MANDDRIDPEECGAWSATDPISASQRATPRSNQKWTPGPWKVGPVDDTIVTGPDGSEIAAIDGDYNDPDLWPIMEANARLIAAAPDMFEALTVIQGWDEHDANPAGYGGLRKDLRKLVAAALSKASEPRI